MWGLIWLIIWRWQFLTHKLLQICLQKNTTKTTFSYRSLLWLLLLLLPPPIPLQSIEGSGKSLFQRSGHSQLQGTGGSLWVLVERNLVPLCLKSMEGTCFQGSGVGILPGTQGCVSQITAGVKTVGATWYWHRSSAKIGEEKAFLNQERCTHLSLRIQGHSL